MRFICIDNSDELFEKKDELYKNEDSNFTRIINYYKKN